MRERGKKIQTMRGVGVEIVGAEGLCLVAPVSEPHGVSLSLVLPFRGVLEPALARTLLQRLDGHVVCGEALRVICAEPIKKGAPIREQVSQKVRRRRLFSRWEQGVQCDADGLVYATAEALARAFVAGTRGIVVDATCGVGSLAIAAALRTEVKRVIALDVDRARLQMARHNARIYGVQDRIEFVCTAAEEYFASMRTVDAILVDPPWTNWQDFPIARIARSAPKMILKLPKEAVLPSEFEGYVESKKELFLSSNWVPKFVRWQIFTAPKSMPPP